MTKGFGQQAPDSDYNKIVNFSGAWIIIQTSDEPISHDVENGNWKWCGYPSHPGLLGWNLR